MGFTVKTTRRDVAVCDGCGYEEEAQSGGGEVYAPRGWTELRTGQIVCSSRCRGLAEEKRRGGLVRAAEVKR